VFAGRAQHLPAGDEHSCGWGGGDQLGDRWPGRQDVLEVVHPEQHRLPSDRRGEALDLDTPPRLGRPSARAIAGTTSSGSDSGQRDEVHAAGLVVVGGDAARRIDRQARLAAAGRTAQRDQALDAQELAQGRDPAGVLAVVDALAEAELAPDRRGRQRLAVGQREQRLDAPTALGPGAESVQRLAQAALERLPAAGARGQRVGLQYGSSCIRASAERNSRGNASYGVTPLGFREMR
jgi:hypothetical protein